VCSRLSLIQQLQLYHTHQAEVVVIRPTIEYAAGILELFELRAFGDLVPPKSCTELVKVGVTIQLSLWLHLGLLDTRGMGGTNWILSALIRGVRIP